MILSISCHDLHSAQQLTNSIKVSIPTTSIGSKSETKVLGSSVSIGFSSFHFTMTNPATKEIRDTMNTMIIEISFNFVLKICKKFGGFFGLSWFSPNIFCRISRLFSSLEMPLFKSVCRKTASLSNVPNCSLKTDLLDFFFVKFYYNH